MRLSKTRFIIESNLPLLDYVKKETIQGNGSLKAMSKVYMAVPAIENLRTIPALRPTISKLTNNKVFSMTMENFTIENNLAEQFMIDLHELKSQCQLIIQLADDTIPRMDKNTICIKLPENSTFDTIAKTAKAFDELLNLVNTNDKIDGTVKLQGVESGSAWLYALATTAAAATFIETIVSCIYGIAKEHIETKKSIETLKQLECITDVKKDEKEIMQALSKKYIEKLNNDKTFEESPEMQARWIKNIATMAQLVEDGMEIKPSLEAPKEKQECSAKKISEVASAIKDIKKLEAAASSASEEPSTDNISDDTPTDDNPAEE